MSGMDSDFSNGVLLDELPLVSDWIFLSRANFLPKLTSSTKLKGLTPLIAQFAEPIKPSDA
jgi:hypothetical protein